LLRKTNNLFFASVGAFLGLSGKFTISEIDYTNPELENYFYSNIKSLAGKEEYLSELVKQFKINNGCFLDGFKDRNYIVKRVCFLLPHVKTFGGVFRFLEISKSFYYLGIDAFIAIIDSDWNDADVISIQKSFPEARIIRLSEAIDQSWDVVVCGDFSSGLFLLLPYFNSKLTCAYLLNGWQHRYINIEQLKLVRPELVVANSSYAAEHYPELAPVVIPGGINMETFGSERFVIKKHLSEINILVPVGRKKPRKRFFDALDACKMLSEKYKINMHTIDAENLEDFSDEKLSHFHHYNLSREQVSELISRMDIAVFPEEDAGWNNPAAEAMAIGCPLVCTSAGTTDFAINGVTAFVVEPRNPKAIYTACEKLIESYEIRKMMSEKGKEIIKNYTWYNVTKKLLDLFEVSINSISAYRESTGSAVKKKLEKKLGV
jgi:glycosyltransferase involved in cell wall biosynthesis